MERKMSESNIQYEQLKFVPATDKDKELVYSIKSSAYRDVVVKQFGEWNESWQRNFFDTNKWKPNKFNLIFLDGQPIGVTGIKYEEHRTVIE